MKLMYQSVAVLLIGLMVTMHSYANDVLPVLEGPYMGQKTPGKVAEPFAPGIISKEGWELDGVFSPNMNEFYYTSKDASGKNSIVNGFRQTNNIWKKYIELPRTGEVSFSPDGNRMHMAKGYRDRKGDGWSELKKLDRMFNRTDFGIMRLSASAKGTYAFDDYRSEVIRVSQIHNGQHQTPKKMSAIVNTGKWTAHPFIAPDESYLIWDSEREGGYGGTDFYISYRQQDGTWGPAINMGEQINSDKDDFFASVTSDGKYIIFNRKKDESGKDIDIYWVNAQMIEALRP